jgi:hypothetical protein
MRTNQNKQVQITIADDKESWMITGPVTKDEENLLNLIDDGLTLVIEARELLARLRD